MSFIETTQRRIGYGGTAVAGTAAAASDIYNSADILEWSLSEQITLEPMTGLNDLRKVSTWTEMSTTGRIRKMVVTAAFLARIRTDPVVYLVLRSGSNQNAAAGAGEIMAQGLAILSGVDFNNVKGQLVEDVAFEFSGDVTDEIATS